MCKKFLVSKIRPKDNSLVSPAVMCSPGLLPNRSHLLCHSNCHCHLAATAASPAASHNIFCNIDYAAYPELDTNTATPMPRSAIFSRERKISSQSSTPVSACPSLAALPFKHKRLGSYDVCGCCKDAPLQSASISSDLHPTTFTLWSSTCSLPVRGSAS